MCVWDEPWQQPASIQDVLRYHGETRQQPQEEARATVYSNITIVLVMCWECLGIEMLDTLRIKNQGKNRCMCEMNHGSILPQYKVSFGGETRQQPQEEARATGQLTLRLVLSYFIWCVESEWGLKCSILWRLKTRVRTGVCLRWTKVAAYLSIQMTHWRWVDQCGLDARV